MDTKTRIILFERDLRDKFESTKSVGYRQDGVWKERVLLQRDWREAFISAASELASKLLKSQKEDFDEDLRLLDNALNREVNARWDLQDALDDLTENGYDITNDTKDGE